MGLTVYGGGGKPEEEKTVTAGTSVIEVLPNSGKTMKKVNVNPTPTEEKTITAGTSATTVTPTSGKYIKKVTVNPIPSQSKAVTPNAGGFTVNPDTGKLLSSVVVNGDSNLIPSNIRKGINIFNVLGTMAEGVNLLEATGCTKIAVDKFIYATRQIGNVEIPHSLGELPRLAIILSDITRADVYTDLYLTLYANPDKSDYTSYAYVQGRNSGKSFFFHVANSVNNRQTSLVIKGPTNSLYFTAGVEYTLITIA